ncbi:hypothetical protein BIU82_11680 [Arthrobacter sp. SW1]|nr:hypothetical protein BIU82_11680 [Arthrobacter sp. SW1]
MRTGRLLIDPLRDSDAEDVFAYQQRPDVVAYLPWPVRDRAASLAHTQLRAGQRVLANDGGAVALAVRLPGEPSLSGAGDRVIGDLTIILNKAANAHVSVGWVIHPDFQGRAFAREAATALLELCFGIGAHRITASVDTDNSRSMALCERLGMELEATHREDRYEDGRWCDTHIYAIRRRG